MFLKSIELFGFKSFADKAKITLSDGISVIVGPNGCGKSNVVDALRWVLGEQGAKGLRTDNMAGIIFNGTEQRHALNVAEVTLTFSNEKNILPLEFSEVEVKRRVFRTGNSEYYVNNNLVTLKHLRELLSDTGIGNMDYIVMEQGRMDHILTAKPTEKRQILEEAAGITKYRTRSAESARRLEKMRDNRQQLLQVLKEVEIQHDSLKIQCDKALKYRQLKESIFNYEIKKICLNYNSVRRKLEKYTDDKEKLEQKLIIHSVHVETLLKDNDVFLEIIKQYEYNMLENQRSVSSVSGQIQGVRESIEKSMGYEQSIEKQLILQEKQLVAFSKVKKEYEKEQKKNYSHIGIQKSEKVVIDKKISDVQKDIKTIEEKIQKAKKENVTLAQKEETTHQSLEIFQKDLRNVVDRLAAELDKQLAATGYSAEEQEKHATKIFVEIENLTKSLLNEKNISDNMYGIFKKAARVIKIHFKEFYDSQPSFLKDFLSNDGVLSRKHIIDKKIAELIHVREVTQKARRQLYKTIELCESQKQIFGVNLQKNEMKKHTIGEKILYLLNHLERVGKNIKDATKQEKDQQNTVNQSITSKEKVRQDIKSQLKSEQQLKQQKDTINKELTIIQEKIEKHHNKTSDHGKKIALAHEKKRDLQNKIMFVQQGNMELQTRLSVSSESFTERYGEMITTYIDLPEYKNVSGKSVLSDTDIKKFQDAKESLRKLGGVNLLAPDEYRQISKRYTFLVSQLSDLDESEKKLKKVIEEIESESRKKLEHTYKEVRKHFKILFTKLMDGGFADIELIDSDDILTAGLEIIAQPPQKKTKHLSQLSGGERALVALALLFAIHSVRPAPFCMLDELDAPLDEQNIGRFISLLENFKDVTQFVVISHNKRTITYGKQLIGVTMEERGVSKIIEVKMER